MEDFDDTEYVASEHDKLVSAVSKLDKTQHIANPTRAEPTSKNTEFNLIKKAKKLDIKSVVKVLENTAGHVEISKKLKKAQEPTKVLNKPLEKPQAERIKRATAYEETKVRVGRWDPVVARSRTIDFVSFPLNQGTSKLEPTNEFLSKFKLKSTLEKELEEVDPPPFVEMVEEEEQLYPMSYEEMVEHRQHLSKLRAQQSYKAAKAKRQSKIKSKKYHRVLKKERLKQQLKEFEELQKKDPEEALKKLEAIEKARALERHTLRHKNTGKWAKNLMIRAKYDKDVRQQLAEQLAVSRTLTKKTQDADSTDDEADNEVIPDINLARDPMNPWMMQRADKSNVNAEFDFGYKKYLKEKMIKKPDDSDTDSNDEHATEDTPQDEVGKNARQELNILKQNLSKLSKIDNTDELMTDKGDETVKDAIEIKQKKQLKEHYIEIKQKRQPKEYKVVKPKKSKTVATSSWVVDSIENRNAVNKENTTTEDISTVFETFETDVVGLVEAKLKKIRNDIEKLERVPRSDKKRKKTPKENKSTDNLEYLKLNNSKKKAIIDEALIETSPKDTEDQGGDKTNVSKLLNVAQNPATNSTDSNIDPNRFIQVKPKYLNTALPAGENGLDQLDDDDEQVVPRVNIEEVFEEDDVVASFRQEKEDEANKDKPEDIDLSLPGWGSWGGKGVKAPKRKKNRFILKAPPKMPRRDENKGDIIIKEYKDPKLSVHKVTDVPFPFSSVKDYEASIRAPLGNTFIPEKAHKRLIRPSVITRAGAIIEPMDEDELLQPKNKHFKNDSIIKILAKK